MNIFGIVFIVIISIFITFILYCSVAINAPRTKEEFNFRFKQDCAEFDKYMEEKRKSKLEKANER